MTSSRFGIVCMNDSYLDITTADTVVDDAATDPIDDVVVFAIFAMFDLLYLGKYDTLNQQKRLPNFFYEIEIES